MNRPTRQTLEGSGWVVNMGSDIDYILALNDYIDWLEGKGDHHDGTEVSHDTEHVCEDEAGPIPDQTKRSSVSAYIAKHGCPPRSKKKRA